MAIGTAHGPVVASATGAPQRRRGGLGRLGRPGAIAMVSAVLAIVLIACGGGSGTGSLEISGTPDDSRDLAPNFSFTLFQGADKLGAGVTDLNQLHGKPLVLNFWAGLCPPCRAEMPDLQSFYDEFHERATLLGIDLGQFTGLGSQQDAKDLLEELGITYPAGFTTGAGVVRDYRVLGMPTTVFIDADGRIAKTWTGALNKSVLEEQTTALLSR